MTQLLRRFRGLAIALAVLAISAGAVFAGAPRFVASGAPVANLDPIETPDEDVDGDEDLDEGDEDEDVDTDEDVDGDEDLDEGDAPEGEAEAGAADGTHGAFVSVAAHMATPDGFENHGAFVSCVAHMKDTEEPVDPTTVTIETCLAAQDAAAAEKAAKHELQAADRAERKAARDAAKLEKNGARGEAKAERAAARDAANLAKSGARGEAKAAREAERAARKAARG